jgi:aspartate 1-decarboxylase
MKYADFYTGSNKITFYNSHLGFETVTINGKQTSKKFSINGALHKFSVDDKEFYLVSEYALFNNNEIKLELYEGKQLIEIKKVAVHKKQLLFWIAVGVFIGYFWFKILLNS